jgi:hypothetical protein
MGGQLHDVKRKEVGEKIMAYLKVLGEWWNGYKLTQFQTNRNWKTKILFNLKDGSNITFTSYILFILRCTPHEVKVSIYVKDVLYNVHPSPVQ